MNLSPDLCFANEKTTGGGPHSSAKATQGGSCWINLIQIKLSANNICANVYADKWRLTERNIEPTCNSNNYTKKRNS